MNIVDNNRYDIVDSVLDYPALVPIHDEFAPADDQGGNHDDDSEGGGNFVSSQMLTEGGLEMRQVNEEVGLLDAHEASFLV